MGHRPLTPPVAFSVKNDLNVSLKGEKTQLHFPELALLLEKSSAPSGYRWRGGLFDLTFIKLCKDAMKY